VARGTASELLEAIRNNPTFVAIAGMTVLGLVLVVRGLQGQRGSSEVVFDLRRGKAR
jgi:hypothetical protein